jgi:hypothetical protein
MLPFPPYSGFLHSFCFQVSCYIAPLTRLLFSISLKSTTVYFIWMGVFLVHLTVMLYLSQHFFLGCWQWPGIISYRLGLTLLSSMCFILMVFHLRCHGLTLCWWVGAQFSPYVIQLSELSGNSSLSGSSLHCYPLYNAMKTVTSLGCHHDTSSPSHSSQYHKSTGTSWAQRTSSPMTNSLILLLALSAQVVSGHFLQVGGCLPWCYLQGVKCSAGDPALRSDMAVITNVLVWMVTRLFLSPIHPLMFRLSWPCLANTQYVYQGSGSNGTRAFLVSFTLFFGVCRCFLPESVSGGYPFSSLLQDGQCLPTINRWVIHSWL